MPTREENEILGDWRVVKGTHYHLVYTIWLLLCQKVPRVAFYQGNDLTARIVPPPVLTQDASAVSAALHVEQAEEDVWVQLKSSDAAWPTSTLIQNLLTNFLYNALNSENQGRVWSARLVSPGPVRKEDVQEFVNNPGQYPDLSSELNRVVDKVYASLQGKQSSTISVDGLRLRAFSILTQLAQDAPAYLEQIKTEIALELAYTFPDRRVVDQTFLSLLGALEEDAAFGPANARWYDAEWLSEKAGLPLLSRGLLDTDPVAACSQQVQDALPASGWRAEQFAQRTSLSNALQQFLANDATLFVLVGRSGTGKSWALADWSGRVLHGRLRVLLPGSDLDVERRLPGLVANRLSHFTSADWRDEQLIRRLQSASLVHGQGPLVIILDDVQPSSGDVEEFRRDLKRLVEECRAIGAKLVLSCQEQVWLLRRLHDEVSPAELFTQQTPGGERKPYSYLLTDLTTPEYLQVLRQNFAERNGGNKDLINQLRDPVYAPLRNPYLLARYLEQYGASIGQAGGAAPEPVVDTLLDERVQGYIRRVARRLECDEEEVNAALDALMALLWTARPGGLSRAQAVPVINPLLPDASVALAEMRRAGLFTPLGDLRFVEPPIADRLFAEYLGRLMNDEPDDSGYLRPYEDYGVVVALLRGMAQDPVVTAERLLQRDADGWTKAVADGLSQRKHAAQDYRVLAMLTAMTRRVEHNTGPEACDALGRLAVRGRRAWKWVAQMYLSDDPMENNRGARAAFAALEFAPRRVAALIRLRLSRAAKIDDFHSTDREKREKRLRHTLAPFLNINHEEAAQVAQRLLARYSFLIGDGRRRNEDFQEDVDEARGLIALHGSESRMDDLFAELKSDDATARFRAACALRPVFFEDAGRVQDALCEAISNETDGWVLRRLLWTSYRLCQTAPGAYLDALEVSSAVRWDRRNGAVAMSLAALSDLAKHDPQRVRRLLPPRLYALHPSVRAYHSEILAYAWWRCAEHVPEAREHLAALTRPDFRNVPKEFRTLALRGAVLAQLGVMCLDAQISASELDGLQHAHWHMDYTALYIDTDAFVMRYASTFALHPKRNKLQTLILRCVNDEENVNISPLERARRESRFRCAVLCLEVLVALVLVSEDPVPILRELPHNWQVLKAVTRLLEEGRTEQAVQDFARRACETSRYVTHEHARCLAQLARLKSPENSTLNKHREALGPSRLITEAMARSLTSLSDDQPGRLLALLHESLSTERDILTLHHWPEETRSRFGVLIARVYARMFDERYIHISEAQELCEQMLVAVRELPPSVERADYLALYEAILDWLNGTPRPTPLMSPATNAVQHSHDLASEVLAAAYDMREKQNNGSWIMGLVTDRRGWWDTTEFSLKDGSASSGSGLYLMYVFPAVRLALVAAGQRYGLTDPAARYMKERAEVAKMIHDHNWVFHNPYRPSKHSPRSGLKALRKQLRRTPRDERLWRGRAHLLLLSKRYSQSERESKFCLSLNSCGNETCARVLYILACIYALTSRPDDCRRALEDSRRLHAIDVDWLAKDPDFGSVREEPWFHRLLKAQTGEVT